MCFVWSIAHLNVIFRKNVADYSSMIGFPLLIDESEQDMPGIEPGPLGWDTSALTTELQEVIFPGVLLCGFY